MGLELGSGVCLEDGDVVNNGGGGAAWSGVFPGAPLVQWFTHVVEVGLLFFI